MGKKIVITGVNGFIGSHMAGRCLRDGYDVMELTLFHGIYRRYNVSSVESVRGYDK